MMWSMNLKHFLILLITSGRSWCPFLRELSRYLNSQLPSVSDRWWAQNDVEVLVSPAMRTAPLKFSAVLKWAFMVSLLTATTLFLITPEIRHSAQPSGLPNGDAVISVRSPLRPPSHNWRNLADEQVYINQ